MTQSYVYDSAEQAERRFKGDEPGFIYSRYANPTVAMFEERMRLLEGAEMARATASGMAAVTVGLSVSPQGRRPCGCRQGAVRVVPLRGRGPAAALRHDVDAGRRHRPRPVAARGEEGQDEGAVPGEPDQPDAGNHRHRRRRRDRPRCRRPPDRRQRLRDAALPAAAGARRRRGRLFGHQAHRRTGALARRHHPRRQGLRHGPSAHVPAPDRSVAQPVQRLAAAEGPGDAAGQGRAADGDGGGAGRPPRRTPQGQPRALPRARRPPAARPRPTPDERRFDDDRLRGEGRAQGALSRSRTRSGSSASPTTSATPRASSHTRRRRPTSG